MIPATIRNKIPRPIKHPILACSQWYWDVRQLPAQSLGDMTILKTILASAGDSKLRVFEWGSGASTTYYTKYLRSIGRDFEWHAMDNFETWRNRTEGKIRQAGLADKVRVHFSEFPGFWQLPGFTLADPVPPQSFSESANPSRYVNMPRELGIQFDVMIVDGRFRRRCLLVAKQVLAPGGVVFLHDAQKTHYHSSLAEFSHSKFIETGTMPGSSQKSTVALCCMGDDSPIRGF